MYIGQTLLIEAELAPFVKFKILEQLSTFTFEKKNQGCKWKEQVDELFYRQGPLTLSNRSRNRRKSN